jgi:hypothetical protein
VAFAVREVVHHGVPAGEVDRVEVGGVDLIGLALLSNSATRAGSSRQALAVLS